MLSYLFSEPTLFALWVLAVVYAITVHEFSHVLAAYTLGDDTGKEMGRLTLNPLAHVDWLGFLMLVVVGFGWGNPAPYNPYQLRVRRWGPTLVSLAGPLSNVTSLVVFSVLFKFLRNGSVLGPENLLMQFLIFLVVVNFSLFVFNLLPIPPLDGSQLLFALLPDRFADLKLRLAQNGPWLLLGLLLIDSLIPGISIFGTLFGYLWNGVYWLL